MTDLIYRLSAARHKAHYFDIELHIDDWPGGELVLSLASWIPGSYLVRDFSKHLQGLKAIQGASTLPLTQLDKQAWQVNAERGAVQVTYSAYAFDRSVRSAWLDCERAFFNGTSLFLRVSGLERTSVRLELSADGLPDHWRVATSLASETIDDRGFGRYRAASWWELIDHPVEVAPFDVATFSVESVPHQFVLSGGGDLDRKRLCSDLAAICAEHVAMFRDLPVDRYSFLTLAVDDGYGGLEHSHSCALIASRADLDNREEQPGPGYQRFLGLCSHEYFHLWNVKRIRPRVFVEPDLGREQYTGLLWAFEGITSYYDELALLRSGCIAAPDYARLFAENLTRIYRNPGRLRQSLLESSFNAWTRFYQQDENAANSIVSYYTKGALVAFGLDVVLRLRSADRLNLDDLMRLLWQRYGKPGIGLPEDGIETAAAELLGQSLDDFFDTSVRSTADLPVAEWCAAMGLGCRLRAQQNATDNGGTDGGAEMLRAGGWIGIRTQNDAKLTTVLSDSPAQQAGLNPGDELVAIDGQRVTASNLDRLLTRLRPGRFSRVHVFRDNQLLDMRIKPIAPPADTWDVWFLPEDDLEPDIRARRAEWMASRQVG